MSSMLEQAIVDATALREAAIKTAETNLIEKYSDQIKEAVETLLEQAPPGMPGGMPPELMGGPPGGGLPAMPPMGADPSAATAAPDAAVDSIPDAALEEEKACPCPDVNEEVTIKLDELLAAAKELEEGDEVASPDIEAMAPPVEEAAEEEPQAEAPLMENKEIEVSEDYLIDIIEGLKVDLSVEKSGWGNNGYPEALVEDALDKSLALAEDDEIKEELEELKKAAEKLQETNEKYQEKVKLQENKLDEYKQYAEKTKEVAYILRDKLTEANLTNAHLLYTNKVLSSASLNERQKTKIVEALSKATSVEETKTIYETLQSAVGSTVKTTKHSPQSLSEVIRRPSTTLPQRKEEKKKPGPYSDRWKILAGIE